MKFLTVVLSIAILCESCKSAPTFATYQSAVTEDGVVACTDPVPSCRENLQLASGLFMSVYRTYPMGRRNNAIRRGIIDLHGADRDPHNYFEFVTRAAKSVGMEGTTAIIAPGFEVMPTETVPEINKAYWPSAWKHGAPHNSSGTQRQVPVSTFDVVNQLVGILANREVYPNLEKIIITGHSAGAQLAHRFAIFAFDERLARGVPVTFVVDEPSTYTYLTTQRPSSHSQFAEFNRADCPGFNDYPYGLGAVVNMPGIVIDRDKARSYAQKSVIYFLGTADTELEQLDQSCEANSQGRHRLERGLNYFEYLNLNFPGHQHSLKTIPDIGHDAEPMYNSQLGHHILFDVMPIP